MAETLVQTIKDIENLSPDTGANKAELINSVWEKWKAKNKIVSNRSEGETTFLKEYQIAYDAYDNYRTFAPYSVPKGFEENLVDLNACIGTSALPEGTYSYLMNPAGVGAIFAVAAAGVDVGFNALFKNPKKMNRREFFKEGAKYGGAAALLGILFGSAISGATNNSIENVKENAIYLDDICEKYIR